MHLARTNLMFQESNLNTEKCWKIETLTERINRSIKKKSTKSAKAALKSLHPLLIVATSFGHSRLQSNAAKSGNGTAASSQCALLVCKGDNTPAKKLFF